MATPVGPFAMSLKLKLIFYWRKFYCKCTKCWPFGSGFKSWASYQIRKIAGCACAGNAGNVSPRRRLQRKTLVCDPVMHHGTCVTHVPWCMSGSLTRCCGENVPGIPGACAPIILRIWQEAHGSWQRQWYIYLQSIVPYVAWFKILIYFAFYSFNNMIIANCLILLETSVDFK